MPDLALLQCLALHSDMDSPFSTWTSLLSLVALAVLVAMDSGMRGGRP